MESTNAGFAPSSALLKFKLRQQKRKFESVESRLHETETIVEQKRRSTAEVIRDLTEKLQEESRLKEELQIQLRDLEQLKSELETETYDQQRQIDQLNEKITDATDRETQLQAQIADVQRDLSEAQTEIQKLLRINDLLDNDLGRERRTFMQTNRRLTVVSAELAALKQKDVYLQSELADLRVQMQDRLFELNLAKRHYDEIVQLYREIKQQLILERGALAALMVQVRQNADSAMSLTAGIAGLPRSDTQPLQAAYDNLVRVKEDVENAVRETAAAREPSYADIARLKAKVMRLRSAKEKEKRNRYEIRLNVVGVVGVGGGGGVDPALLAAKDQELEQERLRTQTLQEAQLEAAQKIRELVEEKNIDQKAKILRRAMTSVQLQQEAEKLRIAMEDIRKKDLSVAEKERLLKQENEKFEKVKKELEELKKTEKEKLDKVEKELKELKEKNPQAASATKLARDILVAKCLKLGGQIDIVVDRYCTTQMLAFDAALKPVIAKLSEQKTVEILQLFGAEKLKKQSSLSYPKVQSTLKLTGDEVVALDPTYLRYKFPRTNAAQVRYGRLLDSDAPTTNVNVGSSSDSSTNANSSTAEGTTLQESVIKAYKNTALQAISEEVDGSERVQKMQQLEIELKSLGRTLQAASETL